MQHSNAQTSMLRRLYLWGARLDSRWWRPKASRIRKTKKRERTKPPWKGQRGFIETLLFVIIGLCVLGAGAAMVTVAASDGNKTSPPHTDVMDAERGD